MVVPFLPTGPAADNPRMPSTPQPGWPEELGPEGLDLAPAWQEDAQCAHVRDVDFFPARGESVREAKAVCAVCPVKDECLEFALRLKVAHGVWGGLSERERRSLRRDRRRTRRGHVSH